MLDSIPVGINFVGEECLDDVFLVALFFAGFFLAARSDKEGVLSASHWASPTTLPSSLTSNCNVAWGYFSAQLSLDVYGINFKPLLRLLTYPNLDKYWTN